MSKKPNEKCLNESQRCKIMAKLSKTDAPNKRARAREYNVNEGAIRKVWDKWEQILERSALMSNEAKEKTFWSFVGHFTELKDMLYNWIDNMCLANLPISPSLAIAKAKSIASSLSIPKTNFKAGWQCLNWFRVRRGLQKMLLHGDGAKVNKFDPGLLAALDDLKPLRHYCPIWSWKRLQYGWDWSIFLPTTEIQPSNARWEHINH